MANLTVNLGTDFEELMNKLEASSGEIMKMAVYEGSAVAANQIRKNLQALPEENFRMLQEEEQFAGVPKTQKEDLLNALGISKILADEQGFINAKIGFDGYGSKPTKKYKQGLPNKLLARSIESGSSVRKKTPFVRPAIEQTKEGVKETMQNTISEEIEKRR